MKNTMMFLSLILVSACASSSKSSYTIRMLDAATSRQGKFEIYESKTKDLSVQAAAQGIRPQIIDFWVQITNKSKKSIAIDESMIWLKNLDTSAMIPAVDPEPGLRHLEEAIRLKTDASAQEKKNDIVKNFLRKGTIKPGKSAAGIVQFLVADTGSTWQLIYKINGHITKGPKFISKSISGK